MMNTRDSDIYGKYKFSLFLNRILFEERNRISITKFNRGKKKKSDTILAYKSGFSLVIKSFQKKITGN